MKRPLRGYEYRVVALLFDLVEGRRDLPEVEEEVKEELRQVDPELDQFLRELKAERAAAGQAAPVATLASSGPAAADALAPVVRHPSAPWRPPQGDLEAGEYDYSPTFVAVAAALPDSALLEAERSRAKRDLNRLLTAHTAAEREDSIHRSTVGMRSPLLVELLLEEARGFRGPDPRLALELTEAALAVVRRISPRHYRRSLRFRLLIRVEAHRANALRLLGAYSDESDRSFRWKPTACRSEATLAFSSVGGGHFGGLWRPPFF